MGTTHYVALLRGVNVGGRNKLSMTDLRAAFEGHGFGAVATYIQSGNVLFESDVPPAALEAEVEGLLERRFGVPLVVVVRSHRQMREVVAKAPPGFGRAPGTYHSDTVFLKAPLTAARAMRVVERREGVDQAWPGPGVLYFARLSERRTQSRMGKVVAKPEYQLMTIRSWTTTTKLVALLDGRTASGRQPG